uniref:Uncharacterized protein n=1 Tax=Ditylenchus dipsaci TaxID=166011 RepID=A0A915EDK7_9BILA
MTSAIKAPAPSHIISDGTFKYAPEGAVQIYRIFGLIRQLHATPLVTALLKRKTGLLYKRMWEKVHDALLEISVVNSISLLISMLKEVLAEDNDEEYLQVLPAHDDNLQPVDGRNHQVMPDLDVIPNVILMRIEMFFVVDDDFVCSVDFVWFLL